jgi:hypothetical protein
LAPQKRTVGTPRARGRRQAACGNELPVACRGQDLLGKPLAGDRHSQPSVLKRMRAPASWDRVLACTCASFRDVLLAGELDIDLFFAAAVDLVWIDGIDS